VTRNLAVSRQQGMMRFLAALEMTRDLSLSSWVEEHLGSRHSASG
jgi:hypothetical protein